MPLHSIGRHGEYVGAVRYKAWQPPSALHPTIGAHPPLTFDLIDTWNDRAVGGCTYHVSHPGGRSYEVFPVNALEAESRRGNRFDTLSHTPGMRTQTCSLSPYKDMIKDMGTNQEPERTGTIVPPQASTATRQFLPEHYQAKPMTPPPEEAPGEYPLTLDLRRAPRFI